MGEQTYKWSGMIWFSYFLNFQKFQLVSSDFQTDATELVSFWRDLWRYWGQRRLKTGGFDAFKSTSDSEESIKIVEKAAQPSVTQ